MTEQAESRQPGGQTIQGDREARGDLRARIHWLALPTTAALLCFPFNRGGLWDPNELRFAELGRRLAHQLFGADATLRAGEELALVTQRQIGQGELSATSTALGFAIFGVSDWAGRLPSLLWALAAIGALWILMGRLANRGAQVFSVLLLASLPLFGWQSRTLLGDAPTIGTLAISMASLALLQHELVAIPSNKGRGVLVAYGLSGALSLVAGSMSRGILVGVAVPTLSVAIVGLLARPRGSARCVSWVFDGALMAIGSVAAAVGSYEIVTAPQGFSSILGSTLVGVSGVVTFAACLSTALHQMFPLSAILPFAAAMVLRGSNSTDATTGAERRLAQVLVLAVVLTMISSHAMALRGVSMPFPAPAAVSGIVGLAIASRQRPFAKGGTIAAFGGLTLAALLLADFVNFDDVVMQMTGISTGRFPEGFRRESQLRIGVATGLLALGALPSIVTTDSAMASPLSVRAGHAALWRRIRSAFGGQLLSGFVLVETALATTALLQRSHDQGWITVPLFDSLRATFGPITSYAWLMPPAALFVAPFVYVSLRLLIEKLTRTVSIFTRKNPRGFVGSAVGILFGGGVVLAGATMSICHGPAIAEQLSPKRAVLQYREHARRNEPIALLGIKPESTGYYLGNAPRAFWDIDAAARWLGGSGELRHWVLLGSDRFAELNAAFRAVSKGNNLVLLDPMTSNVTLATNRLEPGQRDHNPLGVDVLRRVPTIAHATNIEFGSVLRLSGWELRSEDEGKVARLRAGRAYELVLAFEVLGTTAVDWQVFVHLDGRGRRHNGDHDPVGGRYPTTLWQPGDVIVDRHQLKLERTALPGAHVLHFGLFRGNRRLEVTSGQHDDNRVRLGELEIYH